MTSTLYRVYDAAGALLYIGITNDPAERFGAHAGLKPWWHEAVRIDLEHFDTREVCARAELAAIRSEHPRHNIVGAQRLQAVIREDALERFFGARGWVADPAATERFDLLAERRAWDEFAVQEGLSAALGVSTERLARFLRAKGAKTRRTRYTTTFEGLRREEAA